MLICVCRSLGKSSLEIFMSKQFVVKYFCLLRQLVYKSSFNYKFLHRLIFYHLLTVVMCIINTATQFSLAQPTTHFTQVYFRNYTNKCLAGHTSIFGGIYISSIAQTCKLVSKLLNQINCTNISCNEFSPLMKNFYVRLPKLQ